MMPIGVIGMGRMGNYHAKILSKMNPSQLAGIADADGTKAEKASKEFNTEGFEDFRKLFGKVKAVIIAAPTPFHYSVGKECLLNGLHCLIEKPICADVSEAAELIRIAEEKKLVLQVGHVERFNPALIAALPYIKEPKFIDANRMGPYDPRVSHIGVVLDLMIHDLDIVLHLAGSKVKSLEAFGAKVVSGHEDMVKCRLRFENGCIADISASRVSVEPERKVRVFQRDACIAVNYAKKNLKVYRSRSAAIQSMSDIEILEPAVPATDALTMQTENFIQCIREGKGPHVTGRHGKDALELGLDILRQLQLH